MIKPKFEPWIGETFKEQSLQLFILGESHYNVDPSASVTFTNNVIDGHLRTLTSQPKLDDKRQRTFTRLFNIAHSAGLKFVDQHSFWNSVAFYNYIQTPLPRARVALPKSSMRDDWDALHSVVESLKPDCILILGKRLKDRLWIQAREVGSERMLDQGWFICADRKIPANWILHPSSASRTSESAERLKTLLMQCQ